VQVKHLARNPFHDLGLRWLVGISKLRDAASGQVEVPAVHRSGPIATRGLPASSIALGDLRVVERVVLAAAILIGCSPNVSTSCV
jgi:hypothetical protein